MEASKVRRGIGLVAHDAMKKDLIEWVLWNSELLMGNKFYCTGTTGTSVSYTHLTLPTICSV